MNPTLMTAVLDAASFLGLCSDDVLDPDVAVAQLENMVANLHHLVVAEAPTSWVPIRCLEPAAGGGKRREARGIG